MLSCLKMLQNWPKIRFWIGRYAVAPSDTAEKNRNIDAQLNSLRCTTATKFFWKIYFLYDFWCAQTCLFRANFGLPSRSLTFAVGAMLRRAENFFCIGEHLRSRPKPLRLNFIKIFMLSIRSGAHKLFRRFFDFSQFLIALLRKLWRHLTTKRELSSPSERAIPSEKTL